MRQWPAIARRTADGKRSTGSLLTNPTRVSGTSVTALRNRVVASSA